jgi:hypothetical protein
MIVAVSHELPSNGHCGQTVTITNSAGTSMYVPSVSSLYILLGVKLLP